MKFKLLLAPLLIGFIPSVNAIPFSDIVIKTDLGEKYIVKKSAVYITKTFDEKDFISLVTKKVSQENGSRITTLKNAVQRLKNNMVRSDEGYEKCRKSNSFKKEYCEYMYLSEEYVKDNQSRLDYVQKNLSDVEKEVSGLIAEETKDIFIGKHAVMINFRPIFQDLNKQKKGLNYSEIICINPVLKENTSNYWSRKYSENYFSKYSLLAIDSLKSKVCKRYAKF